MTPTPPQLAPGKPAPKVAEAQAVARAEHVAREQLRLASYLREWRIPAPDRESILAGDPGSHPTPALEHVRRFHRQGRDWALVLWGGYRVGKTYAAMRWLVDAAKVPMQTEEHGRTFRYATSARFIPFANLAEAAGSYRDHHQALVGEAITARALVLDDVGAQFRSGAPILDQVVSARHLHRRPTLITTNLGPDLFGRPAQFGQRVALRLAEGGSFRGCGNLPLSRERERARGEGSAQEPPTRQGGSHLPVPSLHPSEVP